MTETRLTSRQMRETGWNPADESWSYASADAPTYVITVPTDATTKYSPGMRIQLTQPTDGVKYFIVTAVAATTLTVYGGTDYDLDNEAITSPNYSIQKAPFGFPLDPDKWSIVTSDSSNNTVSSPTAGTWYNTGAITIDIPIGIWHTSYGVNLVSSKATATDVSVQATLSTANNSESDDEFTGWVGVVAGSATIGVYGNIGREKVLNLSTKDTYYLNIMSVSSPINIIIRGVDGGATTIRAISAYL